MQFCGEKVSVQETPSNTVFLKWSQRNQITPKLLFCIAEVCGKKCKKGIFIGYYLIKW